VTVAGKAKKYPSHAGQRHGLGRFLEELSDEEVPLSFLSPFSRLFKRNILRGKNVTHE
jgi:hypothetical protein